MKLIRQMLPLLLFLAFVACGDDNSKTDHVDPTESDFYFGVDLSYVNQVLDYGGTYKLKDKIKSPYQIAKAKGSNLARVRLWHNPVWTKGVYGESGTQLYSDLRDAEKTIRLSKEQGMEVLLDFHYSDTWADPGQQHIPEAWKEIKEIDVLADSIYMYTKAVLQYLKSKDLQPEFVQIGNETNCGFLYTDAPDGFPICNVCDAGQWSSFGTVVNKAIDAINEVSATSKIKTKIILHVADPKNVDWWFGNLTSESKGNVQDFDIIGFSYYPLWHRTVPLEEISTTISGFRSKFGREVMVLETAYPWTTGTRDTYKNHFADETPLAGFPYTTQGQYDLLLSLTREVVNGGGMGLIYWEPAWISSQMKDPWGTGSAWENNTLFDFEGNAHKGFDFIKVKYN